MNAPNPAGLWAALAPTQREILLRAAQSARRIGGEAYLVGGPVRDLLLGERAIRDLDIVTTADAIEVADEFARLVGGMMMKTTPFGTATVSIVTEGVPRSDIDFATARTELYPFPGSLPEVTFPTSLERDLARRDFTINAIALPMTTAGFGSLIDLHGGFSNLRQGVIRVLHDDSFRDDPTRLFRAIRYATRYDFALDEHTNTLFDAAMAGDALTTLSIARKRHEIELGMMEARAADCLAGFAARGLLLATSSALMWNERTATRIRQIVHPRPSLIREVGTWSLWAAFVCDQDEAAMERLFRDIRLSSGDQKAIQQLLHAYRLRATIGDGTPLSVLARLFARLRPSLVVLPFFDEPARSRIEEYYKREQELRAQNTREHHFDGTDLIAFGVPAGPHRREILDALYDARLDGVIHTTEQERVFVGDYITKYGIPTFKHA